MTDLLPIPVTGEAVDLTAADDVLVEMFDYVRQLELQLREARDLIGAELTGRMDRRAKWSLDSGRFKVSVASPAAKVEYDVDALRATLADLLSDGRIGEEAVDAALEVVVAYKPRHAGIRALAKLGDDVAERVEACGTAVDPVRRLSVRPR